MKKEQETIGKEQDVEAGRKQKHKRGSRRGKGKEQDTEKDKGTQRKE